MLYFGIILLFEPFLMLFVLQRSHVLLTITNPSESLLNELRTVEVCSSRFLYYLIKKSEVFTIICYMCNDNSFTFINILVQLSCLVAFLLFAGAGYEAAVWWKKVYHFSLHTYFALVAVNLFWIWFMIFRNVYEYMVTQQKEKGRSKGGKGETFTLQQLQTARDEYDEVATLCVFRLKSLKEGQSRSLLTQAARHHAAQVF